VIDVTTIGAAPPAGLRFKRRSSVAATFPLLWRRREVVRALVERDFRARYKQAFLGITWAFVQPLIMVLVFNLVVRKAVTVHDHGVPYVLFSYVGLLPWNMFSEAITLGSISLVSNQSLLNKLNCPREAFPTASVFLAGLDMLVSLPGLIIWFFVFGFVPKGTLYMVIPILAVQLLFTWATTLIVSILLVYVRDLRQIVPLLMQVGLLATPVAYGMETIPHRYWTAYSFLNPMGPIIDSYRRVILYGQMPNWHLMGPATITTAVLVLVGIRIFKRLETGIADIL
jgi:ABC-type polysaccharide/polyol phosphate export permease